LGLGSNANVCAALACRSSRTAKLKVESLSPWFLSSLAIVNASPKKFQRLVNVLFVPQGECSQIATGRVQLHFESVTRFKPIQT
jgi:hypothetical protein